MNFPKSAILAIINEEIKNFLEENQKELDKKREKEIERYLGSLNESNQEILKGINDKFALHDIRFDRIDKKLDSHTEMIGELSEDMTEVKERLERVEDKLGIREPVEV